MHDCQTSTHHRLCGSCVERYLEKARQERNEALAALHNKQRPTTTTTTTFMDYTYLEQESQEWREKLQKLRQESAEWALQVANTTLKMEEQQEQLQRRQQQPPLPLDNNLRYHHIQSLELSLQNQQERIRKMRFEWALHAYKMHRINVQDHEKHEKARGIGKICGLPLPHAGVELYSVLPPNGLESALRLVASATATMAKCLGILLPHPILLSKHYSSQQDIIERRALLLPTTTTTTNLPFAQAAVLLEAPYSKTSYFLKVNSEDFGTGLLLLQNNVVALCIRAGVPIDELGSAESLLWNLHALSVTLASGRS